MKTTLILVLMAWGLGAGATMTLKKDLGVFGNWRSAQIENHTLWGKNACLAYTQTTDGKSTLEVYAPELSAPEAGYAEPSVQIVTAADTPRFIRAIAEDNRGNGYQLTLASNQAQPTAFGLLSRLKDRQRIVDSLKKANTLSVKLIGERNKLVKTLTFSLKGSSKSIDAIFKGCALTIDAD